VIKNRPFRKHLYGVASSRHAFRSTVRIFLSGVPIFKSVLRLWLLCCPTSVCLMKRPAKLRITLQMGSSMLIPTTGRSQTQPCISMKRGFGGQVFFQDQGIYGYMLILYVIRQRSRTSSVVYHVPENWNSTGLALHVGR